jgi:hypothetical protein
MDENEGNSGRIYDVVMHTALSAVPYDVHLIPPLTFMDVRPVRAIDNMRARHVIRATLATFPGGHLSGADGVPYLSSCLLSSAFTFQLSIAGDFSRHLLNFAFDLLGGAFDSIFVHFDSPLLLEFLILWLSNRSKYSMFHEPTEEESPAGNA